MTDTGTLTIADFLLARIAEDEQVAQAATAGPWSVAVNYSGSPCGIDQQGGYDDVVAPGDVDCMSHCYGGSSTVEARDADWKHIARFDPARVLDECKAKRAIVEQARDYCPELEYGDNGEWAFDLALAHLAAVYASHPDYDPAWAPKS